MTEVADVLPRLLADNPDLTARDLAWRLRSFGLTVHKRELNPLLYSDSRYAHDGGYVPRWRLANQSAARPDLETRIEAKKDKRRRLDATQEHVTALRSGRRPDPTDSDDADLAAAIALLRRRGIDILDVPHVEGELARPRPAKRVTSQPAGLAGGKGQVAEPIPADGAQATKITRAPRRSRASEQEPTWLVPNLHPWQKEALSHWFAAGCVGICEAVTGTGKTHLGLEAVAQTVQRGRRATVLVPSIILQRQWELRLAEFVGQAVIAKVGGTPRGDASTADVVIAVVNSAIRTDLSQIEGMELLVADETHRYGGEGWAVALRDGYTRRLGLTATLERGNDDGVDEQLLPYFNAIAHRYGYDRATRENVVAPFDLIFLGVQLDDEEQQEYDNLSRRMSKAAKTLASVSNPTIPLFRQLGALRSMGGDVTRAVITYENTSRERRRLLAETSSKHHALRELSEFVRESDGSVIFTQSITTALIAAEVLRDQELTAEAVHSDLKAARRQQLISALADGDLQALSAPRILDEGVDVPDVNLGLVMGASTSRRQMIQRLGRVIRLKANHGRARFVILYVRDTVEDPEHGAREDFMLEVEGAASHIVLEPEWDEDVLSEIWAGERANWQREAAAPAIEQDVAPPSSARDIATPPAAPRRLPAAPRMSRRKAEKPDESLAQLLQQIDALSQRLADLRTQEAQR